VSGLGRRAIRPAVDDGVVNAAHDPAPGNGTPRPERRPGDLATAGHDRGLRILLVEDDPGVRRSTARLLERLGHAVLVASDGVEALERTAATHAVDVVVTDAHMPRLGGIPLIAHLRERSPLLPAVLMTGSLDAVPDQSGDDGGRTLVLRKPFGTRELAEALATLMLAR